jgi:hypothetical protein
MPTCWPPPSSSTGSRPRLACTRCGSPPRAGGWPSRAAEAAAQVGVCRGVLGETLDKSPVLLHQAGLLADAVSATGL